MAHHHSPLDVLLSRASTDHLVEPPPKGDQLRTILSAGLRAPDHGKLRPWRYTVIKGKHRDAFASLVVEAMERQEPDAPTVKKNKRRQRFSTMPMIIALGIHIEPAGKIPVIEQEMAVAAGAMNVLNALHVEGFGGMWITGAFCEDRALLESLGLPDPHRIVGFLFVGTPGKHDGSHKRPDVDDYMAVWKGEAVHFGADAG
ncbi:nitroreductase family protein [Gluconobacter morbifer]|uniref:Putative NAD(P)H nitroreductase n=1 Tax=Gluconobacter morbifer G707 TaxID=1088869 RepID=G6XLX3_9PROT|nr:nitroreductase [Gluconobacter morbifer]EHH67379.1 putative oxidoreductase [Gluconobacter morbifer G707]